MANQTLPLTSDLRDYLLSISPEEPDILKRLREETARMPQADMQIAPEQGRFMAFLVRLMGARNALEVGVFTGYSAMWVALAMGTEGRLTACDISKPYTRIAERFWEEAGIRDRIELRIGSAAESLEALLESGRGDSYDFAFIDADKEGYDVYYELALLLVKAGGLIAFDNMLRGGRVIDAAVNDSATRAIRRLNVKLRDDPRVDVVVVPIGDGVTLVQKR